jgi:hypothetical protein
MAAKKKKKQTVKKKKTAKKPAPKKKKPTAAARPRAAAAYGGAVAEIIDARSRKSSYVPKAVLALRIANHRQPKTTNELLPDERVQLEAIWHGRRLDEVLGDTENEVEVAEVKGASGATLYRLYGWNYGVGYLFPRRGLDVVAFGSQHDIEVWRIEQRDLFAAMDAALRKPKHGFRQPLSFGWWNDDEWAELEDAGSEEQGAWGSEKYIRERLAKSTS